MAPMEKTLSWANSMIIDKTKGSNMQGQTGAAVGHHVTATWADMVAGVCEATAELLNANILSVE